MNIFFLRCIWILFEDRRRISEFTFPSRSKQDPWCRNRLPLLQEFNLSALSGYLRDFSLFSTSTFEQFDLIIQGFQYIAKKIIRDFDLDLFNDWQSQIKHKTCKIMQSSLANMAQYCSFHNLQFYHYGICYLFCVILFYCFIFSSFSHFFFC